MPTSNRPSFQVGDRVVHKLNPFSTATGIPSNKKARHGVVVEVIYKVNKRGAKHPYVVVQFDNSTQKETYSANRVTHETEKQAMLESSVESIN